jgi:hypothetical protein
VKYWARLGCWILPCYGQFSLGGLFETYEPFISLLFNFFSGRCERRILNQCIRGHDCTLGTALINHLNHCASYVHCATQSNIKIQMNEVFALIYQLNFTVFMYFTRISRYI